ncbi:MAG: hypothetical protein KDA91_15670 [Planctomycetaceae bacterium]|nr:hypothetical protein [Planctomycetaceae bacterium]
MPKRSRHPGPRARSIHPAQMGDDYAYVVDKFWVVDAVGDDGTIHLKTRRGKTRSVPASDPLLRKATWWERWWHRNRFPAMDAALNTSES